jgi:23S rRNA pseudouridine1911/1915/1917 synthase
MNTNQVHLTSQIPLDAKGERLDQVLAKLFPEHSRSRLKEWIDKGYVQVNGAVKRPKDKVKGGEQIEIRAEVEVITPWSAEPIELEIVFEDEDLLVINKPPKLVVHPAAGHRGGTLVNALLHYVPALNQIPRAGVVHRLDKDTTGLLVVAKTTECHNYLVEKLQAREVERIYEAVVQGVVISGGTVDAKVGRHPHDRKRMAVVDSGKNSVTHYRVLERFRAHTHVQLKLETGRTHQIRVHMAHINHPVFGDKTYGGRLRVPPQCTADLLSMIHHFPRQALHAKQLSLIHPRTQEPISWEAPLPQDFQDLLTVLKNDQLKSNH